jgi:nucleoside-diphosphate-sugar epimerase
MGSILVTGTAGFIGSHLAELLLERGCNVRGFDRLKTDLAYGKDRNVTYFVGDVCDVPSLEPAVKNADYIFHLAALQTGRHSPEEFFRVNVQGTVNMLEACCRVALNIKKFVYISSISAAGPRKNYEVLTEDSTCLPRDPYGRSKLKAEELVLEYSKKIPVTIIRPSLVYGPRDRNPLTVLKYMKMVNKGFYLSRGPYNKYSSHIYVKDLAEGLVTAAESDRSSGQKYFLCSDMPTTYDEICVLTAEALQKKVLKITIPSFLLKGKAFLNSIGERKANADSSTKNIPEYWICDGAKAKRELGVQTHTSLAEGITKTAKWYLQEGWL